MARKKTITTPFSSTIRTIGRKAQLVLDRAKRQKQPADRKAKKTTAKSDEPQAVIMHLSLKSVVRATLAIFAIYLGGHLIWTLRQKILLLLLAAFVATIVDPGVEAMERWRIPRGIAILIHYLAAIFLVLFLLFTLIPTIAEQLELIGVSIKENILPMVNDPNISLPFLSPEQNKQFQDFASTTLQNLSLERAVNDLQQTGQLLSDIGQEAVRFATSVAGTVTKFLISFAVVLVLAFFMQLEKERILRWLHSFLPERYQVYARRKGEAIHVKIGQWMRGELTLMFSIFAVTYIALWALQLQDFALTLALLAGFCELIPAVGPLIAAIPAILIGGVQKGFLYVPLVALVYYLIQWTENNFLVPLIMKRAVGLSPIAILFAMMVGVSFPETIHPVLGVMLAVPTTTILAIFLEDWRENK